MSVIILLLVISYPLWFKGKAQMHGMFETLALQKTSRCQGTVPGADAGGRKAARFFHDL